MKQKKLKRFLLQFVWGWPLSFLRLPALIAALALHIRQTHLPEGGNKWQILGKISFCMEELGSGRFWGTVSARRVEFSRQADRREVRRTKLDKFVSSSTPVVCLWVLWRPPSFREVLPGPVSSYWLNARPQRRHVGGTPEARRLKPTWATRNTAVRVRSR